MTQSSSSFRRIVVPFGVRRKSYSNQRSISSFSLFRYCFYFKKTVRAFDEILYNGVGQAVQHKGNATNERENQTEHRLNVGNLSQNASVNKIWWGSFEVTWVRANIKVDHEVFSFDGGSYKKKMS